MTDSKKIEIAEFFVTFARDASDPDRITASVYYGTASKNKKRYELVYMHHQLVSVVTCVNNKLDGIQVVYGSPLDRIVSSLVYWTAGEKCMTIILDDSYKQAPAQATQATAKKISEKATMEILKQTSKRYDRIIDFVDQVYTFKFGPCWCRGCTIM